MKIKNSRFGLILSVTCILQATIHLLVADERGVPEQYGHPGDWRDHDWSDSNSTAPSQSRPSRRYDNPANVLDDKATDAMIRHDFDSDVRYCEQALRIDPTPGRRFNLLGARARLAESKADWKSAINYYEQASRAYPAADIGKNIQQAKLALQGQAAAAKGDWKSAIYYYGQAVSIFPKAVGTRTQKDLQDAKAALAQQTKSGTAKNSAPEAPSPKAVVDRSTASTNKKSSEKSALGLTPFSQSQRQTTGPAAQREANGSNTSSGDQLVKAKSRGDSSRIKSSDEAAAEEAAKGFDQSGGSTNGKHLDPVNLAGSSSTGHPDISTVPDKYKKNPTKYAEIMGYDREARESASKVQKLKQDLAKLEEKTPSDSNERGKNEVAKVKVRTDLKIAESHRDAAELNKRDKMRQFAKAEGL